MIRRRYSSFHHFLILHYKEGLYSVLGGSGMLYPLLVVFPKTVMSDSINDLKYLLSSSPRIKVPASKYLSSGSTLLNLACSGSPYGCYMPGGYYFFVGDSESGKTFLCLTALAEAMRAKRFKKHRIIHDDVEGGALMDIATYFGDSVASRLEPPAGTRDEPIYSKTVEDFYYHIDKVVESGDSFIYILDSENALTSEAGEKKLTAQKKAREKGKEESGTYGMDKPKTHSNRLNRVVSRLRGTDSILIIIGQTRDNIGITAAYQPKTYSGGRALWFYANLSIWSSTKEKIKKTVKGKPRQVGMVSKVRVKKNRLSGKDRTIYVPIYHSVGVDDVGSCVDYLVEEKRWTASGGKIRATDLDFVGTRDALIRYIEKGNMEDDLRDIVGETWDEIEEACKINRKKRY